MLRTTHSTRSQQLVSTSSFARRSTLALVLTLAVASSSACTSSPEKATEIRATQGVIVTAAELDVWRAVQAVLPGAPSAGVPQSAASHVGGVPVEARVERYNDTRTILHVTSPDARVAEEVQLAIQRELLR